MRKVYIYPMKTPEFKIIRSDNPLERPLTIFEKFERSRYKIGNKYVIIDNKELLDKLIDLYEHDLKPFYRNGTILNVYQTEDNHMRVDVEFENGEIGKGHKLYRIDPDKDLI